MYDLSFIWTQTQKEVYRAQTFLKSPLVLLLVGSVKIKKIAKQTLKFPLHTP